MTFLEGWDQSLGYQSNKKYVNYPCVMSFNPTYNHKTKCDLNTDSINSQTQLPHVDIYGIERFDEDEEILIEIPRVQLSN